MKKSNRIIVWFLVCILITGLLGSPVAAEEASEAGAGSAQEGLDLSEDQTTEADQLSEDIFFTPDSDQQQVNTDNEASGNGSEAAQDVSAPEAGQAGTAGTQEQYSETDSESVYGQGIADPENTQEITGGPEEQVTDAEESRENQDSLQGTEQADSLQGTEQAGDNGQEDPAPVSDLPQEIPESEVLIECGGEEIVTVTPAVMGAVTADETVPSFTTLEETIQYVRERAEVRQESITVQIPQEIFDQLDLLHYSDIFAHTGDPRGGDYLLYSVVEFGATCSPPDETRLLEYHFQYRTTASQEEEADRETVRLVSSLGLNDDSKSVYDKIKAIHDYISENVEYDHDTYNGVRDDYPETYSGYGALVNHLAVCQGYSSMFYRLCLEAGIDARVITSDSLGHAWNIVEIDNIYYLIDCTWDENADTDVYFLRGVKDFFGHKNSDDNFQNEEFASQYPLSEYKYGFVLKVLGKAPDYTLITADRRTISTAAQNGRAKVLIFFKEDCPNAQLTLNSLRGKEFDGIDFVYVYMLWSSADQQTALSRIGSEFPTDLPGTYAVCANGGEALYTTEEITGIRDPEGWIYSTTVFFIDPDNNIIFAEQGFGGDLSDMLESLLENPDLPPAPGQGADEYAGFTAIGNCGQNAVWRLYEDGTLKISGSGQLYDNGSPYSSIGWLSDEKTEENSYSCENIQAADIKKVIVDEGITYIGCEMFSDCSNLQSIDFYGHAPEFFLNQTLDHDIKVYFPENDASWNNVDKSIFSKGTKWISRDASGTHHHKWSSWKTTKAATTQTEGSKERSCTECGKKETAVISRLPKISVDTLTVTFSSSIVYTGKALEPAPTVKAGSTVLKAGTDYTVSSYTNNTNAGTATATLTGKGDYTGTRSITFTIKKADQSITVKSTASTIDVGKTATVSITGAKGTKSFKSSNTAVATVNATTGVVTGKKPGTVTITAASAATSDYNAASGTVRITVALKKPGDCRFVKWNNAKYNSCQIAWNKVGGADGYQSILSWTDGSHATTKILNSSTLAQNCSVAVNHVSQFKVRAFTNTAGGKVYSQWSNVSFITPSPTTLKYKSAGTSSAPKADISWNIIYGCNGYNVFLTTNPNGTWYWNQSTSTKAAATSAAITKYRGAKLKKGTRYYVRIVTRRQRNGVFCTVPLPAKNTSIGSFVVK